MCSGLETEKRQVAAWIECEEDGVVDKGESLELDVLS